MTIFHFILHVPLHVRSIRHRRRNGQVYRQALHIARVPGVTH